MSFFTQNSPRTHKKCNTNGEHKLAAPKSPFFRTFASIFGTPTHSNK